MSPVVKLVLDRLKPAERQFVFDALVEASDEDVVMQAIKDGTDKANAAPKRERKPRAKKATAPAAEPAA